MTSANHAHLPIVEELLKHSADINMQDSDGWSALMMSTYRGHLPIVEELLKHRADINMHDKDGWSALMMSAYQGHLPIVEELLKCSADINMPDSGGWNALIMSAYQGHLPIVQELLKHSADIHMQNNDDWSALMMSTYQGHLPIVEELLKQSADINMQDSNGLSALMLSACQGHLPILVELLKHDAHINMKNSDGRSSLMMSAYQGHLPIVEELLKQGADINVQSKRGSSALIIAAYQRHLPIVEELLKQSADINMEDNGGYSALMKSANQGHQPIVEELLQHSADINLVNTDGWTALMMSANQGHLPIVEELLKQGADINVQSKRGSSAIIIAANQGHLPIVEELLKHKAVLNMQDNDVLFKNIGSYNTVVVNRKYVTGQVIQLYAKTDTIPNVFHDFVVASLEQGIDITVADILPSSRMGENEVIVHYSANVKNKLVLSQIDDQRLLHWAVDIKLVNFVWFLLYVGVDIDDTDNEGWSVLFIAVKNNDIRMTKLLLDHNATVDMEATDTTTPISICNDHGYLAIRNMLLTQYGTFTLYTALQQGNKSQIQYLIKKEADLDKTFSKHESALHVACANNHTHIVAMLLNHNVCPYSKDLWGRTSLHISAWYGHETIITILSQYPPTVNMYDINGWTPLHIAARESNYTCTHLLIKVDCIRTTQNITDRQGYTALDYARMGRRRYHKEEDAVEDILINLKASQPDDEVIRLFDAHHSPTKDYGKQHIFSKKLQKAISLVQMVRQHYKTGTYNFINYRVSTHNDFIWALLTVDGLGFLRSHPTTDKVKETMTTFLQRMVTQMQIVEDSAFSYELGGSTVEHTKTGLPDEFDCQINLTGLAKCVYVSEELEHNLVLKLLSLDDEIAKYWMFACGADLQLQPDILYGHFNKLMCKVLAVPDLYTGLPLMWKYIENEQIHLELRDTNIPGIAIKIDVVFVVQVPKWFPKKGRNSTPLLCNDFDKLGACILLKGRTCRSSTTIQEGIIMKSLPVIPKCAYVLAKIINSLMVYNKDDAHNRVRSFDLKNALMYEVHASLDNKHGGPITLQEYKNMYCDNGNLGQIEYTDLLHTFSYPLDNDDEGCQQGYIVDKGCKVDIKILKNIIHWTRRLCEQGLKQLLRSGRQPYYFGLSHSRMTEDVLKKFLDMVDYILTDTQHEVQTPDL